MVKPSFFADKADKKFKVTLSRATRFRGMRTPSDQIVIRIFNGASGQLGFMTGASKRMGQSIYDLTTFGGEILSAVEVLPKEKKEGPTPEENLAKVKAKLHPNAWPSIRNQVQANDDFLHGPRYCNPISKFRKYDQKMLAEQVQAAFDGAHEFHHRQLTDKPSGRDLTIRIYKNADGTINACFDSEYMGCGNGDYWLYLNPTTAVFGERD
jgi:hypothetical protein